jgi:uncharacterized protein (UPF0333 family)
MKGRLYMLRKGQADIVFQVLVAVILMSMVLAAGSYSMQTLSNTKCSKQIDAAMSNLGRELEKTASSSLSSTYFNFEMPTCFGVKYKISVIRETSAICKAKCPGVQQDCFLLKYNNDDDEVNKFRYQCVNISTMTSINPTSCDCPGNSFDVTDGYSFRKGLYQFRSESFLSPVLCVCRSDR